MKTTLLKNKEKIYSVTGKVFIIAFVLAGIYLSYINNTLWFDGAYSMAMAKRSWADILKFTANDFHPPLYYFILKIFIKIFGSSVFVARMVSLLPVVFTLILTRRMLKKYFGGYAFVLFVLAFLASKAMVLYSLEIRMYSWALFFVTMTHISAFYALQTDSNRWYVGLFLFFLATFYTQYYAGLMTGIVYSIFMLYTWFYNPKRVKTVLFIALLSFLLYLPWLIIVKRQFMVAVDDFWIADFYWTDSVKFVLSLFTSGGFFTSFVLLFLFAFSLISFVIKKSKQFEDYFFFSGVVGMVCLLIFGTVLSLTVKPLLLSRYLVPAGGLLWMFFATQAAANLKNDFQKGLIPAILLLLSINSFLSLVKIPNERDFISFTETTSKKIGADDVIVMAAPEVSGSLSGVIAYLMPGHVMAMTHRRAVRSENYVLDYHNSPFDINIIRFADLEHFKKRKKWLFLPYNAKERSPESYVTGSKVSHVGNFGWVDYQTGYQFELYEIEASQR